MLCGSPASLPGYPITYTTVGRAEKTGMHDTSEKALQNRQRASGIRTVSLLSRRLPGGFHAAAEPRSVDVIVTSPPYNLGIRYNTYEDTLSQADYLEWTGAWIAAAARVLKPRWVPLSERRHPPVRSVDGARRRAGGPAAPADSRTSSTGSSRSPSIRSRPAPPPV